MPVQAIQLNTIRATFDRHFANGDFTRILAEGQQLLKHAKAEHNYEKTKIGYLFLIKAYYYLGQFEKAYEYALYYQQLCVQHHETDTDFYLCYMQAHIYEYEKKFELVQKVIEKGLVIAEKSNNYAYISRMKIFSSNFALTNSDLETALSEAQAAMILLEQYAPENLQLHFRCQTVLTSAYNRLHKQNEPSFALYEHPIVLQNVFERCRLYYMQALDSVHNTELELALQQLHKAYQIAEQSNNLLMQLRITQLQATIFEKLQHYKEALNMMKQLGQLKETFNNSKLNSSLLAFSIKNNLKEIQNRANLDPLSGVYNRYYLEEYANTLLARAALHNEQICCIVFDVDNFKHINDTYGHLVGDKVIKMLGQACKEALADTESVIARYGGDEFVILAKSYGKQDVIEKAQRVFNKISSSIIHCKTIEFSVTISMGIVCNHIISTTNFDTLFHAADEALYRAKQLGKQQIVYVEDDSEDVC